MKKIFLLFAFIWLNKIVFAQSVAINEDASSADPSAILDIKSTTKGLLIPRMSTIDRTGLTSPAEGLKVFDTDTKTFWFHNGIDWIELASGGASGFWSLNGAHIFKNNSGNIGIGISDPFNLLTVQSAPNSFGITHTDGSVRLSSFLGGGLGGAWLGTETPHAFHIFTNNGSIPNITFRTNFITELKGTNPWLRFLDGAIPSGTIKSNGNDLAIVARTTGLFSTPGNLLLQVDDGTATEIAGNVGIGTSAPPEKLTVQTLNNSYGISHRGEGGNVLMTRIGGTSAGIGTFSNTHMRIFCNGLSEIFIAAATGNVGIGTENFGTYKLAVNGNIRTKEVVVESGWADYVFDDKYNLPSLQTVEEFIRQNKHLPNIPSAKEIEEKGLHLGDVQKRMMEKIEELTLYMIEASKQIQDLKKEIEILKIQKN